ncbi:MAG: pilus assembly protein PilP [bacterium]
MTEIKFRYIWLIMVFFFILSFFVNSHAQDTPAPANKDLVEIKEDGKDSRNKGPEDEEEEKKRFVYKPGNRRDPFRSLLRGRPVEPPHDDEPPGPLQIDLGSLKLVGIIWGSLGNKALVETSDGKAYVVKIGMRIGKNRGKVIQIKEEEVTIVEYHYDYLNNRKEDRVSLKLQKEK